MGQKVFKPLIDSCNEWNRGKLELFAYLFSRRYPIDSIELDDGTDLPGKPKRHDGVRFEIWFDVDGKTYAYADKIPDAMMFGKEADWDDAFHWMVAKIEAHKVSVAGGHNGA